MGAGPAGTALAAALCEQGLRVVGVAPGGPHPRWRNTYGIWEDELVPPALTHLLGRRWSQVSVNLGGADLALGRTYGLFDNARLQAHLLDRCAQGGMHWHDDAAVAVQHHADGQGGGHSEVITQRGQSLCARLVVDAAGHAPVFVQRNRAATVAYQAAYGIVGTFSAPPVGPEQMMLMDYRADHLTAAGRTAEPPTFLYAMDLGDGRHFVEETSLAHAPAVPLPLLEERLHLRLAHAGIRLLETHEVERCLFPMNLPLPPFDQPVLGYGGAASMVHPASGYQVGAALLRAPVVARALAAALDTPTASPANLARAGWDALWPSHRLRNHRLYLFGLENVLRFDVAQTQDFFRTFFRLPYAQWSGYLSNTLTTPELMGTMLNLFGRAPARVRTSLATSVFDHPQLLVRAVRGR